MKIIYDTNFYTDLSSGYEEVVKTFQDNLKRKYIVLMPSVIELELLSHYKYDVDENVHSQIDNFIELSHDIIPLNQEITVKATDLRRKYRLHRNQRLKTPDAIIAASAIIEGAILFSNNESDFSYATEFGLLLENPITNQTKLQHFRNQYKF